MPLAEMSPNIQETDNGGRKRSHDEFSESGVSMDEEAKVKDHGDGSIHPSEPRESSEQALKKSVKSHTAPQANGHLPSVLPSLRDRLEPTPHASPELTEAASSTPVRPSPDPSTPSKQPTNLMATQHSAAASAPTPPTKAEPAKRRRLTPAEKEARDKEAAEKKKKKEEEEAERKKRKEEEEQAKAARMKEKEEQRKQKAEKDKVKAQEREEARLQKEEKKRKAQEEKDKEARKQPKLNSFFAAPGTPKKIKLEGQTANSPRQDSPIATPAASDTAYRKKFKPFFVRDHTTVAESGTRMDMETREAKSAILDGYINGTRTLDSGESKSKWAAEVLALDGVPSRRGKLSPAVKHIMDDLYRSTSGPEGPAEEPSCRVKNARSKLATVPMKVISFAEDVRPPYYGTLTWKPFIAGQDSMRQLAQTPLNRDLLPLDYGYDSEAEWQEDEEGEDVDLEDDDEDLDDEDDMDGFLDDSEDAGPSRIMALNAMEPHCTGLQFEDAYRRGCTSETSGFKLEVILDNEDGTSTIDPWSSDYWAPEPKKQVSEKGTSMAPPPAPANAFAALAQGNTGTNSAAKLVKTDILDDVKKSILANKALSKAGIVDFVFQQFRDNATRTEVKNTIELVAERKKGTGKAKEWDLKPGHEIVS